MEKNIYTMISQQLVYLNPALKRIAKYILENLAECKTITTKSLAATCDVAESTVTRFVREIGFSSFQEMKISIAEYLMKNHMLSADEDENNLYEDIKASDDITVVIDKLVFRNTLALSETQQTLNHDAVIKAVDMISQCSTLILVCQGFSSVAAKEAVLRFARIGKKAICSEDESTMLMMSSTCSSDDLVIGISNTGRTTKVVAALKLAKANGSKTIGITSFEDSPIVKYSDTVIVTPTKSKAEESGTTWETASSKTAQILVIDILCAWYSLCHYDDTLRHMNSTYKALINTREPK